MRTSVDMGPAAQREGGRAGGRPGDEPVSAFSVLLRHFLRQFWSLESVATGGDVKHLLVAVLSLLAGPGLLAAMFAVKTSPRVHYQHLLDGLDPLLWYWDEEWLLLVISMVATGALVAMQWRSLVLGTRDCRVLGVLPVTHRQVLRAKLVSVLLILLGLHLAVNLLGGFVLPLASPLGYLRTAAAMQAALLAETVFVCSAIVALQSLVALVVPSLLAERAGAAVQTALFLGLAVLLAGQDVLADLSRQVRDTPHSLHLLVPVAWFMGLYKHLLGAQGSQVAADARHALVATLGALAAALPCVLLGYRDAESSTPRLVRAAASTAAVLDGAFGFRHPSEPPSRAISAFLGKVLARSATSALIARSWIVVGTGVMLATFGGAVVRHEIRLDVPTVATVAPAFILPLFALVGLRASASYPAILEANWIFRLTEARGSHHSVRAIRATATRRIVLPLLALVFACDSVLWGPGLALAHTAWALAVALITIEWLFFGFTKIPFTCSYLPGKAGLRARWPHALVVAAFYCGALPAMATLALRRPTLWVVGLLAFTLVYVVLSHLHTLDQGLDAPLVFDDRPVPLITELRLAD